MLHEIILVPSTPSIRVTLRNNTLHASGPKKSMKFTIANTFMAWFLQQHQQPVAQHGGQRRARALARGAAPRPHACAAIGNVTLYFITNALFIWYLYCLCLFLKYRFITYIYLRPHLHIVAYRPLLFLATSFGPPVLVYLWSTHEVIR